jgi:hypothetical protein
MYLGGEPVIAEHIGPVDFELRLLSSKAGLV